MIPKKRKYFNRTKYQDDPSKTFRHTDFIKADFNELKKEPDFVLLSHFSMRLIGKFQMSSNV